MVVGHKHRLMAQPFEHDFVVYRIQDGVEGVAFFEAGAAISHGEQVQIMVAQNGLHAVIVLHGEAQDF